MTPRGGWFFRPVGLVGALVAVTFAFFYLGQGQVLAGLASFGLSVTGVSVFYWSIARDRRWRTAASLAAREADERWWAAVSAAVSAADLSAPDRTGDRPASSGSDLVAQARHLKRAELKRCLREASYAFKRYRSRMLGDLVVSIAEQDNARRAAAARQDAVIAARSAIQARGWLPDYAALLLDTREAASTALGQLREGQAGDGDVVLATVEAAVLALVAEPAIRSDQFAALYGPWWRAVVADKDALWGAPWSNLSLAGFWLTLAGVLLAATLNQGAGAYISLGVLSAGVALLAAGTFHGAAHSVPWPEPVSHLVRERGSGSGPGSLGRLWRAPERIFARLSKVFRSVGLT